MKGIFYEAFGKTPVVTDLTDPSPRPDSVVIQVKASGLCLSDWHGWMGHDADITLPHVPGHEFAGVVVEVGSKVKSIHKGMRVTVPFVGGCGTCETCQTGHPQICPQQFQPGFTHWGSFATYVDVHYADFNIVELPDYMDYIEAASLGCRFTTAFRALVDRAHIKEGETLSIFGCGGVGMSALLIAVAMGVQVVVFDPKPEAREMARRLGAATVSDASEPGDIRDFLSDAGLDGCDVSIDAFGSPGTCLNAISSLRRGGRHVQVGLIEKGTVALPVARMIAEEISVMGSHGIQASRMADVFRFIDESGIQLEAMINRTCGLTEGADLLTRLNRQDQAGLVVITKFDEI